MAVAVHVWQPYLDAFTRMQLCQANGDPVGAKMYRREMVAILEASPDYWRAAAIRAKRMEGRKRDLQREQRWYAQAPYPQGTARGSKRHGRFNLPK